MYLVEKSINSVTRHTMSCNTIYAFLTQTSSGLMSIILEIFIRTEEFFDFFFLKYYSSYPLVLFFGMLSRFAFFENFQLRQNLSVLNPCFSGRRHFFRCCVLF